MTVADAQSDLLGLIGIEDAQYASTQVNTRILSDINASLQKLWTMLPPWWSTKTTGQLLRAPVQVTDLTVTAGSKTVVTATNGAVAMDEDEEMAELRAQEARRAYSSDVDQSIQQRDQLVQSL